MIDIPNKYLINKYTLRSKDIPLVNFSLYKTDNVDFGIAAASYDIEITHIYNENKRLFPKDFHENIDNNQLFIWVQRRKAPKNRHFVDKILSVFEEDGNPLKYVDISHALSLNDAYWITSDYGKDKWADFNLYEHPFDEVVQQVAFTGYSRKISGVITSPEITSKGALKKCWSNRKNGIYLIKGDSMARSDGRSQITAEFYAAQIAAVMNIPHIKYDLDMFSHRNGEKELICTCKLFTGADIGYLDAFTYFKSEGIDIEHINSADPAVQARLSKLYGKDAYADMMLFDAVIGNQDRHYGNFGVLVDNNTGKILKPAPIFDNGCSLLYRAEEQDLNELETYIKEHLECRYLPLDTQAKWFVQKRHLPFLRRLMNFKFEKHPKYNVEDETLDALSEFIQIRARQVIGLYREKEQEMKRLKKCCDLG